MLRNLKEIYGYKVEATDGDVGEIYEFYFDDETWTIRFIVVDTGGWLSDHSVLISPEALGQPDWVNGILHVLPTRKQIEKGPSHYENMIVAQNGKDSAEKGKNSNLRSTREVAGYYIQAADGDIGHVDDFIMDDQCWVIRYIIVDTRNWLPGKKVLLSPQWIEHIRWTERKVSVNLLRDTIKNSPEFDPGKSPNKEYEEKLYRHYGRQKYWD